MKARQGLLAFVLCGTAAGTAWGLLIGRSDAVRPCAEEAPSGRGAAPREHTPDVGVPSDGAALAGVPAMGSPTAGATSAEARNGTPLPTSESAAEVASLPALEALEAAFAAGRREEFFASVEAAVRKAPESRWKEWMRSRLIVGAFLDEKFDLAVAQILKQVEVHCDVFVRLATRNEVSWDKFTLFGVGTFYTVDPPTAEPALPMSELRLTFILLYRAIGARLGQTPGQARQEPWSFESLHAFLVTSLQRAAVGGHEAETRKDAVILRKFFDISFGMRFDHELLQRPDGTRGLPSVLAAEQFVDEVPRGDTGAGVLSKALRAWLRSRPDSADRFRGEDR